MQICVFLMKCATRYWSACVCMLTPSRAELRYVLEHAGTRVSLYRPTAILVANVPGTVHKIDSVFPNPAMNVLPILGHMHEYKNTGTWISSRMSQALYRKIMIQTYRYFHRLQQPSVADAALSIPHTSALPAHMHVQRPPFCRYARISQRTHCVVERVRDVVQVELVLREQPLVHPSRHLRPVLVAHQPASREVSAFRLS
jgi:hypothetical protein